MTKESKLLMQRMVKRVNKNKHLITQAPNISKIFIDGHVCYLRKIDSTHLALTFNPSDKRVERNPAIFHIDQLRNQKYYNDVRQWLKTGNQVNGNRY